jgi:hypothetical protein
MSETEIEVNGLWTEKPSPEKIRTIRVEKKSDSVITITSTDNLGSQYLMLPEEGAVELAEAITATVENTD